MHPVQVPWTTVTNPHPARPTVPTVWFALFFTSCLESSQEACFLDVHMAVGRWRENLLAGMQWYCSVAWCIELLL